MFSTTQISMLEPMVQALYNDGYIYYIAHTNTNLNSYNNYDFADVSIYFSKEPIYFENNNFLCDTNVLKYDVITRNISSSNTDSYKSRFTSSNLNVLNLSFIPYEWYYSNAIDFVGMDILSKQEFQLINDTNYDINNFYISNVLVCIIILLMWFKVWFARNYNKGGVDSET